MNLTNFTYIIKKTARQEKFMPQAYVPPLNKIYISIIIGFVFIHVSVILFVCHVCLSVCLFLWITIINYRSSVPRTHLHVPVQLTDGLLLL